MCLGNSQGNFQLHRFTTGKNIAKSFMGATFLTHTVYKKSLYHITVRHICWCCWHAVKNNSLYYCYYYY